MRTASNETEAALAFGWRLDIDSLKERTRASKRAGYPDPATIVEAELWLDLVKAEIAAQRGRGKSPEIKASLDELRSWRSSLRYTLQTLKRLESS